MNVTIEPTAETPKQVSQPVDNKTMNVESQLMSVSVRGWITLLVVLTVCTMSCLKVEVKEPLYTMTGMIIAFYFGQNKGSSAQTITTSNPQTTTTNT